MVKANTNQGSAQEKNLVCFVAGDTEYPMSIHDANGEKWIPAKQVGDALGTERIRGLIKDLSEAGELIKDKHCCTLTVQQVGDIQSRNITALSYRGVIRCAMRSEGKRAKEFRDWAEDVLYSVMTTGAYSESPSQLDKFIAVADRSAVLADSIGISQSQRPFFINRMILEECGVDLHQKFGIKPVTVDLSVKKEKIPAKTHGDISEELRLTENEGWQNVISAWMEMFGTTEAIRPKDVLDMIQKNQIPISMFGKSKRGIMTRIGFLLRKFRDKRFSVNGTEVVTKIAGRRCNSTFWVLQEVAND